MNTDDDQVRALLEDAVSDVEPRRSLEEIRSRTTASPRSRRPWVWGAGGAVLATAATIAAIAVLSGGPGTTDAGPDTTPATQPTGPTTSATERPGGVTVTAYYVGDTAPGARLFPESYPVEGDVQVDQAVERAITGAADDPDYSIAVAAGHDPPARAAVGRRALGRPRRRRSPTARRG